VHTQSERCHQDTKGYVKITANRVKEDLISEKSYQSTDFSLGTINNVLNRLGYTLKKVRKNLPLKRIDQTDAIFDNVAAHRKKKSSGTLKLSIDVKDKVRVGQLSRKGYHRHKTDVCALDKDQHWDETLVPFGILDIASAQTTVILGNSNETSDFIVDSLEKWYEMEKNKLNHIHTLEIYSDNGPAVHSNRTQFINRMMAFACITGLNIHLIYYPPYHSKYNPIERVWAAVEQYWNGTILASVDKVVKTLENVKWKGVNIRAIFTDKQYQKGIKLSDKEMHQRETFLQRKHTLDKWDIWIKPSIEMGTLFFE
jgi:Rhodopirellula transposase DDE domain